MKNKNIRLIPTNNISSLYLWEDTLKIDNSGLSLGLLYRNLYITSDEEINQQTKPCWCINTIKNTCDAAGVGVVKIASLEDLRETM